MSIRFQIAAIVYLMTQAVMFGIGAMLVLATPLSHDAMALMPWVIGLTAIASAPLSWRIAPRLRASFWRERGMHGDAISG